MCSLVSSSNKYTDIRFSSAYHRLSFYRSSLCVELSFPDSPPRALPYLLFPCHAGFEMRLSVFGLHWWLPLFSHRPRQAENRERSVLRWLRAKESLYAVVWGPAFDYTSIVRRKSRPSPNRSPQFCPKGRSTYASLSLRLLLGLRTAISSAGGLVSSLLSSIARRSCSSSSYAASRLFMVERRFGLEAESLPRDF